MHVVDSPVTTGLILVCEKCGKRLEKDHDENPSRKLVSRLKKSSRDLFGKGEVRAVLTSCLDICPENRISVVVIPTAIGAATVAATRFLAVKASDLDETSKKILKELGGDRR
jgi:predicted metal-binding protein